MDQKELFFKVQEFKNEKPFHTFGDLEKIIRWHHRCLSQAFNDQKIYPYLNGAQATSSTLAFLHQDLIITKTYQGRLPQKYPQKTADITLPLTLASVALIFTFTQKEIEDKKTFDFLSVSVNYFNHLRDIYLILERRIKNELNFEIHTPKALEGFYLAPAKFFIGYGDQCFFLDLHMNDYKRLSRILDGAAQKTDLEEMPPYKMKKQLEEEKSSGLLQTIILVKESEKYPLKETVLPLAIKKYQEILNNQRTKK